DRENGLQLPKKWNQFSDLRRLLCSSGLTSQSTLLKWYFNAYLIFPRIFEELPRLFTCQDTSLEDVLGLIPDNCGSSVSRIKYGTNGNGLGRPLYRITTKDILEPNRPMFLPPFRTSGTPGPPTTLVKLGG
ncbi:13388_t:CDS:2, partial [Acaulospora colombiana]